MSTGEQAWPAKAYSLTSVACVLSRGSSAATAGGSAQLLVT